MPDPDTDRPPLAVATAPGKVILLGEHAVVYDQPALAAPVHAVSAHAAVYAADHPLRVVAHYPAGDARPPQEVDVLTAPPDHPLAVAATGALQHAGRTAHTAWRIEITSTVPTGRGLGSSAAVAVALVRAVGEAAGEDWDEATVAALAYAAERKVHGTPSGIDNTVVAYGRPIHFRAGRARPLPVGAPLEVVIADSGHPGATAAMVDGVRARRAANRAAYDDWFRRIGRLADEAAAAIAGGDAGFLGRLMNQNHLILQAMEVSSPALDLLVAAARGAGALGAKLSGAGGGGVVIALAPAGKSDAIEAACRSAGAVGVIRTTIGAGEGDRG